MFIIIIRLKIRQKTPLFYTDPYAGHIIYNFIIIINITFLNQNYFI